MENKNVSIFVKLICFDRNHPHSIANYFWIRSRVDNKNEIFFKYKEHLENLVDF